MEWVQFATLGILVMVFLGVRETVAHRRRFCRRVLGRVAERTRGEISEGLITGFPTVVFRVDGEHAELAVSAGSREMLAYTRLQVFGPAGGTMRVASRGAFQRLRRFFGAREIATGIATFDGRFVVEGERDDWVDESLDAETREHVHALANLGDRGRGAEVLIESGPPGVTVRVGRNLGYEYPQILDFLEHAVALAERARRPPGTGIVVLEGGQDVAALGRCPVCGQGLEGRLAVCGGCRTPHHAECWDYFGGCAIYACRGGCRRS